MAPGDHSVVGISRTPERLGTGIEGRFGNYDQRESLLSAYRGLDRLALIPSADDRPGARGAQLTHAIDAALRVGVRHVVLVSLTGTKRATLALL